MTGSKMGEAKMSLLDYIPDYLVLDWETVEGIDVDRHARGLIVRLDDYVCAAVLVALGEALIAAAGADDGK